MSTGGHGWQKQFIITALTTIVLLALGEASLRLWAYFFRHPYQRLDTQLGMIRLKPGYRGTLDGRILQINSLGFRAAEFTPEKPADVFRIIMIGDSATFGGAGDDCHYPGVLQRLFQEKGRRNVEVINAAVEGYNSLDALRLLQRELLRYSPDLITALIGWNDLVKQDPARPAASDLQKRLAYAIYDIYLIKFWRRVIYLHFRRALLRIQTELPPAEESALRVYVPIVYEENLQNIITAARDGGSRVILFALPSLLRPGMSPSDVTKLYFPHFTYNLRKFFLLYERYNETVRHVGKINAVPVVELQEAIRGRESEIFMDTAHMECAGHQLVGRYLHPVLSDLIERRQGGAKVNGS